MLPRLVVLWDLSSWLADGLPVTVSSHGLFSVPEHSWYFSLLIKTLIMLDNGEGDGIPLQSLAWKIPWTEEPGRLQPMGSLRVGHN